MLMIFLLDFDTKRPSRTFVPTPTPDTETLHGFNLPTKTARFPPRPNSLLNNDQDNKYNGQNRLSYNSEVVELFCTTGFDCGNGVCLSSEKVPKIANQENDLEIKTKN